jgi:hypothetical protein
LAAIPLLNLPSGVLAEAEICIRYALRMASISRESPQADAKDVVLWGKGWVVDGGAYVQYSTIPPLK